MCGRCGHDSVSHLIAWPALGVCLVSECSCGLLTEDSSAWIVVIVCAFYLVFRIAPGLWAMVTR